MVVRTQTRTQAAPTSGTLPVSQSISFSLGGKTPTGVIVELTSGTVLGTAAAPSRLSIGYSDVTNQFSVAAMAESGNGAGTTDTGFLGDDASIGQFPLATSEARDAKVRLASVAADNVTLEWDELPTAAIIAKVTVYYGDGSACRAGTFLGNAAAGQSVDVTGVGFKYGHLHLASNQNQASTDDSGANARLYVGFSSHLDGIIREGSHSYYERDRPSDLATHCGNVIRDVASVLSRHAISATGAVTDGARLDVTSVHDDGFVLETNNANQALGGIFLAVNTRRQKVWCAVLPANQLNTDNTGTRDVDTDPKGAVKSVFAVATRLASANAISSTVDESGDWCLGHSDGTTEAASVWQSKTMAATGSTRSAIDSHLIRTLKDDGSDDWVARFNAGAHADGLQVEILTAGAGEYRAMLLTLSDECILQPSPVGLGLSAPAVTRRHTLVPAAVQLDVDVPAVARLVGLVPQPVELELAVPAVARLLAVVPAPVPLALMVPAPAVVRTLLPSPVALGLSVPAPAVVQAQALTPAPVLLGVAAPAVARLVGLVPQPVELELVVAPPDLGRVDVRLTLRALVARRAELGGRLDRAPRLPARVAREVPLGAAVE